MSVERNPEVLKASQDRFNQNFQAIQAFKQAHGGTWEDAYKSVTGQKWPTGSDVKIDAGGQSGHLVKDPNILGKVAKIASIAAPIAAAPFTGGATLAMLGAGAGAASGVANHQGVGGTLLSAGMGAAPGVAKGITSGWGQAAQGASQAAPGVTGSAATGYNPTGSIVESMSQGAGPSLEQLGANAAQTAVLNHSAPEAGSVMNRLLDSSQDMGKVLGNFADTQAQNRYTRGNQTQNYDQIMLNAQANKRADETDALKKLAQTSYIMGGGANFHPPSIMLNGQMRSTPDYGFGPKASSPSQVQGATTLNQTILDRLKPGGSYMPKDLESYTQPGPGEKFGNYGQLITSGLDWARRIWGR